MSENDANGGRTFVTITNRDVWESVNKLRDEVRNYTQQTSDYPELKARVRGLELKFYALLAGVIGAIVLIVAKGGIPFAN